MNDSLRLTAGIRLEDRWLSEEAVGRPPRPCEETNPPGALPSAVPAAAAAFLSRLGSAVSRYVGDPESGPTWAPRRATPADAGEPGHMCDSCHTLHRLPPPPPHTQPTTTSALSGPEKKHSLGMNVLAAKAFPIAQQRYLFRRAMQRETGGARITDMRGLSGQHGGKKKRAS